MEQALLSHSRKQHDTEVVHIDRKTPDLEGAGDTRRRDAQPIRHRDFREDMGKDVAMHWRTHISRGLRSVKHRRQRSRGRVRNPASERLIAKSAGNLKKNEASITSLGAL